MTNHIDDDADYPMYLYEYNTEGFHSGRVPIRNEAQLSLMMDTVVKKAINEAREVRITDSGDFMVFHARNGQVLWPSPLA